ncbi:thioredoxin domain-containing protein [Sphingomonas cavernae]|uniref:Thioredoxin domain-containing protein n=1 Tax=Sphingomonas cavernae TaxID=2320861 RepID=A0A418W5M7_9SPHN|nr:thioredoxin domain-containing protein [Sphingomonas cavernae]RJF85345.1 hypothetical protein D3876_15450 [Sphingomonas cavernae]
MIGRLHLFTATVMSMALPATLAAATLDTRWTEKALIRHDALVKAKKEQYELPEVRVYDARGRLLLRKKGGGKSGAMVPLVENAIRAGKVVSGPSLAQSMAELETRDGKPATGPAVGKARYVVVDYWADWCLPCKVVSKELTAWAARQPAGKVLLVRAETDLTIVARRSGQAVKHRYIGLDGKEITPPKQ